MRSSTLFLLLLLATALSAADDPNRFESVAAGVAITKPADWTFMSQQSVMENRARIKLQSAEFETAVLELASAPLVVIAKHPEPYDNLNPSLQVLVRSLPEAMAAMSAEQILQAVIPTLQQNFADFRIEQDIQATKVAGRAAADFVARYTVATTEGRSFPTRARMVVIPRSGFLLMIGMTAAPEGPDGARAEFKTILESLTLTD
jgi:hypothetical protein